MNRSAFPTMRAFGVVLVFVLVTASFRLAYQRPGNPKTKEDASEVASDPLGKPAPLSDATPAFVSSPHVPLEAPTDGFVGSECCQDCHEDQFSSWHASYHRRMTQFATAESVIGRFEPDSPIEAYDRKIHER